jgi:hypothetical protein
MPEVVVYEISNIFVYEDLIDVILNTAPNLNGIDEEIEITQASNAIVVTQ